MQAVSFYRYTHGCWWKPLTVANDTLQTLIVTYGAPLLFVAWVWWQSRGQKSRDDPAEKIMRRLDEMNARVSRIEGYLEGKGD